MGLLSSGGTEGHSSASAAAAAPHARPTPGRAIKDRNCEAEEAGRKHTNPHFSWITLRTKLTPWGWSPRPCRGAAWGFVPPPQALKKSLGERLFVTNHRGQPQKQRTPDEPRETKATRGSWAASSRGSKQGAAATPKARERRGPVLAALVTHLTPRKAGRPPKPNHRQPSVGVGGDARERGSAGLRERGSWGCGRVLALALVGGQGYLLTRAMTSKAGAKGSMVVGNRCREPATTSGSSRTSQ